MITLVASEQAKQAKEKLKKIQEQLLKKFLEQDLEKLREKKNINDIAAFVNSKASSVYMYAKLLDKDDHMELFQEAIHLLAQSPETNRGGLFCRNIAKNKEELSEAESEIEKFWKSSSDTDKVGESSELGPNIIKKLNSERLSGVLKAFIALVAWDYINITDKTTEKENIQKLTKSRVIIIDKIKSYFKGKADLFDTDINPFGGIDKDDIIDLKSRIEHSKLLKKLFYELAWVEYCNKSLDRPSSTQEFFSGVNLFYDISENEFSVDSDTFESMGYFAGFLRRSKTLSSFATPFINDLGIIWWMIPQSTSNSRAARRVMQGIRKIKYTAFLEETLRENTRKMSAGILDSQPPTMGSKTPYRKQEDTEILKNVSKHLETIKNMCGETSKVLVEATQTLMVEPLRKQLEKVREKQKSTKKIDTSQRYVPYGNKIAGSGGYGKVQVYFDNETKQKVAVKTNIGGTPFDEQQIKKVQSIDSPYVAKIIGLIDVGTGPNTGLVMEYVRGKTSFAKAIHRFSGNTKKIFEICSQLVSAFQAFARAGLWHNDLTCHSNNILLDKDDNVKIIDYDSATDKDEKSNIKNALEIVAGILVATDYESFENFKNRLELEFQLHNRKDFSSAASLVSEDSLPSFEKLSEVLEELGR